MNKPLESDYLNLLANLIESKSINWLEPEHNRMQRRFTMSSSLVGDIQVGRDTEGRSFLGFTKQLKALVSNCNELQIIIFDEDKVGLLMHLEQSGNVLLIAKFAEETAAFISTHINKMMNCVLFTEAISTDYKTSDLFHVPVKQSGEMI